MAILETGPLILIGLILPLGIFLAGYFVGHLVATKKALKAHVADLQARQVQTWQKV